MSLHLFDTGRITVTGGGRQYRPLVHVVDVAKAACQLLTAPPTPINGEIFNISHTNMRVSDVAGEVIKAANRPVELIVDDSTLDTRNYRVANDKAFERFGFRGERSITNGAEVVIAALEAGRLVASPSCVRLNGYRMMLARDVL
jgi:nucleoside-diphosphate-sugar epimerase